MRFTSPDPAASPFYNLFAYCGNSPASCYDPDGLEAEGEKWEAPMLYRWSHFLFDDYMASGEKGEHARDTFNVRALKFLSVGTIVSNEDVAIMDEYAAYKGHQDVAARAADAFETTKSLAYFVPYVGGMTFALDVANRVADGDGLEVADTLILATRVPGLRRARMPAKSPLPKLPRGYHYKHKRSGTVVARNPGQGDKLCELYLRDGKLTSSRPPSAKGHYAWPNVRERLGTSGWAKPKQDIHHWCIPQNTWGKWVPDWIKNRKWNLKPMPSHDVHMLVHGHRVQGLGRYGMARRIWHGSPWWFRIAGPASAVGGGAALGYLYD
jgi:hypothetical protein